MSWLLRSCRARALPHGKNQQLRAVPQLCRRHDPPASRTRSGLAVARPRVPGTGGADMHDPLIGRGQLLVSKGGVDCCGVLDNAGLGIVLVSAACTGGACVMSQHGSC